MRDAILILSPVFLVASGTGFIHANPVQAEAFPASQRTLQEAGLSSQPLVPQPFQHPFATEGNAAIAQAEGNAPTTTTPISFAPIPTQVNGSFTGGNGAGFEQSFFGLDGFIPLTQTSGQDLTFLQGRLLLSTDGDPGGNVILGYRRFVPTNNAILGAYIGYDVRDSGRATFNQLGAGVEGIWSGFEVRVNGYLPIGDTRQSVDRQSFTSSTSSTSTSTTATPTGALRFQGNFLAIDVARTTTSTTTTNTVRIDRRQDEIALGGFDAEAGVKLAQWQPDGDLRSYLGLYYYSGSNVGGFVGIRGRLVARINQYASIGASVQGDPEFGTTGAVTVALQFPGMSRRTTTDPTTTWARMGDSVNRSHPVAITDRTSTRSTTTSTSTSTSSTSTSLEAALNPATGQPYFFEHVVLGLTGGNGTFENPFGTVANAIAIVPTDGNGIVYVQPGSNPGIPAFTIPNNVQVLSTGPVQTLPTVQYGVTQLPLSGAGLLPSVTNTVTMGNNTVLSGFAITPPIGNPGIVAPSVQTVTIRDNRVQASGDNTPGISLQNMTGTATIRNNAVSTNGNTTVAGAGGSHAIAVNASTATLAGLTVTENALSTTGASNLGMLLFAENAGRITNATIASNTLNINSTNGGGGIAVQTNQGGQVSAVTLTTNTISTTGDSARGLVIEALNSSAIGTVTATGTTLNTTGAAASGLAIRADSNSTINGVTLAGSNITTQGIGAAGVLINPTAGSIATAALSDNAIATSGDGAIGINVSPGNAGQIGNLAINNNRITPQSPLARFGILLDTQSSLGAAIATSTLSQNTITAPENSNTIGIELRLRQPAVPFQTTISNNTIQAGSSGILLVSDLTNGTATISGNTITRASSSGISVSPSGASGIVRAVVDNNTIANVSLALGFQYGINLSANDGSQLLSAVTNNRVSNTNAFVSPSQVEYRFFSNNGSGTLPALCTQVLNNSASNSGYLFQRSLNSVNAREPLSGNTGTVQPDIGFIISVPPGTCGF